MSEKHGNSGTPQWTKAALAQKQQHQQQQQHVPGHQLFENSVGALAPPSVLYGGGVTHSHLYAPARFQPPAIHHHASAPPAPPLSHAPTSVFTSLGAAPAIQTSNVPAPSGFVPPLFPPTVAVTSVLTPNPYASAPAGNVNPFGLDQFQHLNPQQQLGLSKLVSAMHTAAAVSLASTATGEGSMAPMPLTTNAGGPTPPATVSAPVPLTQATHGSATHHAELPTGSGAINASLAAAVVNAISVPGHSNESNNTAVHGRLASVGVKIPDAEKMRRLQETVEAGVGESAQQQIVQILDRVSTLKPTEKLLLYLRLPAESPETDPLRHPQNPLGTRSEINHTINWVRSHLEHDPQVSIPKQDVYNDYTTYCDRLCIKPLSTADFGKVMKQVFPGIRPRRLGTRGHSRYCYAAMRKTTKLGTPQLPELGGSSDSSHRDPIGTENSNLNAPVNNCIDTETWETIKGWAENLLNVKLEDAKDLATRIKSNSSNTGLSPAAGRTGTNVPHKKYAPREPKEKRTFVDMGPLKKRRKKKRKGSSSSESGCAQTELQSKSEQNNNNDSESTSTTSLGLRAPTAESPTATELNLLPVKEEFLDCPSIQIKNEIKESPTSNNLNSYVSQQEMMPINLAPEQRTVLAKAPPAGSNFAHINHTIAHTPHISAVKNLTQKIMEISNNSNASPPLHSRLLVTDQQSIKEEIEDEYIATNILCKKVRKAQQTKGFWQNSPTPPAPSGSHIIVPIITSTATTPPMGDSSVDGGGGSSVIIATTSDANYLMGPPTQTSSSASISPSSGLLDSTFARVSSRNMMQLRAKKQQATHDDTELPEDLGLPRERVISICNMDKHELDDYFMSDEEESQDQDTELLQYFQTGDAEEKLNSLNAAKLRNPTANQAPKSLTGNNETAVKSHMSCVVAATANVNAYRSKSGSVSAASELAGARTPTTSGCGGAVRNVNTMLATPPTVGSASASLALMSQKHQKQQQKIALSTSNKRKISFNTQPITSNGSVTPARKNCIFLPISPNINSSIEDTKSVANGSGSRYAAAGGGFFASPGLKHMRVKPTLSKQQSLDCDSSDPMIGQSSRRRRSYVSSGPYISASAPPSPSLQIHSNKQQQQSFSNQWPSLVGGGNDVPSNAISLLNEQNSLDLDLFGADASANVDYAQGSLNLDEYQFSSLNETQRSQSVPLSQLQRIHSPTYNRSFPANFSACTSMAQTPVPPELVDSTHAFSENSSSQHSGHNATEHSAANIALSLVSDGKSILDDMDFNDFVTDFNNKFPDIGQASNAATTTCSSTGSSSGYSSGGTCTNFGTNNSFLGSSGGIVSRSVPSTPLPHHQYNLSGNANFYRRGGTNEETRLSPTGAIVATAGISAFRSTLTTKYCPSQSARTIYDISKSMPTTPITTPCFSYSPTEGTRDFLINGNTVDSTTSFVGVGSENLINNGSGLGLTTGTGDALDMDLVNLNADTLIDDTGVSVEAFPETTPITSDAELIMVGADLLDNL